MKNILLIMFMSVSLAVIARENPGSKKTNSAEQRIQAANCFPGTASADLDINNVRAKMLTGGDMWWDLSNAQYEVPIGSGKHSIYAGSIWIGGIDGGGNMKVAAQTYRQTGDDYWPGAMDTTTVDISSTRCQYYDRFWRVTRQAVQNFVSNGTTTPDIVSWPGNGSTTDNEGHYLAPYFDANGDGVYNSANGDYPGYNLNFLYPVVPNTPVEVCDDYLLGDKSIWWVINDVGNSKTATSSDPIGVEIRCQAFAFQSSSPAIDNATFYKYQVINRSSSSYSDMYFGQWVDPDLGNYVDDYVGCDVVRGLGYCYNGDANDETAAGYGMDPPAIGIDILRGPKADIMDAVDNDRDGCLDCTFIDSSGTVLIIPELLLPETISMSKFVYYNNVNGSPTGNPIGFADYYNYLRGMWLNNQPITYGGNGNNPANPVCSYMFPGTTDPAFATNWTEVTAGNSPEDRRFLQSAGPFTMQPGEVNHITTAVLWARQTGGGPLGSVSLLQQYDTEVQQLFSNCFRNTGVGLNEYDILPVTVYPNPSTSFVRFEFPQLKTSDIKIEIFNSSGKIVYTSKPVKTVTYTLDLSTFASGTYLYRISDNNEIYKTDKFVVLK